MITRTARVILGLLRQSPESIWDLKRTLRRRLADLWSESDGQLYPAVRELIIDELITADPCDGPRHRTKLHITEHGRAAVAAWLRDDPQPDTPRDELALRISLLHERVDPNTLRHLDDELQRCLRIADTERARLGSPDRYTLQVTATAAHWLARRWVILLHEARAAWCREAITLLRELVHPELNPLLTELEPAPVPAVEPMPSEPLPHDDAPEPTPPRRRSQPIDIETLMELARSGKPIPRWDG